MNNRENELNLIISEPPLKRFKKQIEEKISSADNLPALPVVFPVVDTSFVSSDPLASSPKESTLEKWRKSFQSSSLAVEEGMKDIELLSDGFFSSSDPPVAKAEEHEDFDFDFEGISEIDQEILFEQSSRYESVHELYTI